MTWNRGTGLRSIHRRLDAVNIYLIILTVPKRKTGAASQEPSAWTGRALLPPYTKVCYNTVLPGCPLSCRFRVIAAWLPFLPLCVQWVFEAAPFPWEGVYLEKPVLGAV